MAYSLYLAGFDVKDVTMTDLISGRETLEDVNMIVYCGGFSNSDVLGSAKGWAGAFLFNPKAKEALDKYYAREDTLSLGVCNGCQLMMELNLINPELEKKGKMLHNDSHKFESRFLVTKPYHIVGIDKTVADGGRTPFDFTFRQFIHQLETVVLGVMTEYAPFFAYYP